MRTGSFTKAESKRGEPRARFLQARLGSLLAVAPLGAWTAVHVWHNLAAFRGADAWQSAVTEYPHPFAEAGAGILVLLPLAIHTVWGIGRLVSSRPNSLRYGYYANLKYLLQRLAALGVILFLGAHLWLAFLRPRLVMGRAEPFEEIAHEMHFHFPTLAVYVLGTLGVAYHLANGAHTFCMSWGIVSSRRGLQRLEGVAIATFVILLAMSWGAIYALWAAAAPRSPA
ncbi:MAG: succinate dehydrogenase [Myxococcota bacterium]|nr:succinate dehydrogenase [Myxococcota bacterium]